MPQQPRARKLAIAASFYPLYFFTSQIGGEKVNVLNVTPADAEPHDYEPTAQDIARIESSRVLILNGNFEPWGDRIKENVDPKRTVVVIAGQGPTTQQVIENRENILDPHVWLSPRLAKQMVDKIAAALTQADPENADHYGSNARILKSKLDDLDNEYRHGLARCAKADFITSHAAFGYLATTYHLKQVPIAGLSPDAEPSPRRLADIASFARKNNVKVIFFESLVSPKLSQTIATEVGAQTMVLDPIEGVTNDESAAGKDYLTKMRQNLANLRIALQCAR
jgi:zinc transport system substrate-binding protein